MLSISLLPEVFPYLFARWGFFSRRELYKLQPWAKSSSPTVFMNWDLLEQGHTHSFMMVLFCFVFVFVFVLAACVQLQRQNWVATIQTVWLTIIYYLDLYPKKSLHISTVGEMSRGHIYRMTWVLPCSNCFLYSLDTWKDCLAKYKNPWPIFSFCEFHEEFAPWLLWFVGCFWEIWY